VPALLAYHDDVDLAWAVVPALGKIGAHRDVVVPFLLDQVERRAWDPAPGARPHLLDHLAALADLGALEAIPHFVRCRRFDCLQKLGPAARGALPALRVLLEDENARVRAAAAATIGRIETGR